VIGPVSVVKGGGGGGVVGGKGVVTGGGGGVVTGGGVGGNETDGGGSVVSCRRYTRKFGAASTGAGTHSSVARHKTKNSLVGTIFIFKTARKGS
jgi:hypothetical protein